MRDIEKQPYSTDEARVAKWFSDHGTGGGDDPIGSILASHEYLAHQQSLLRERLVESYEENLYAALHCGVTGNGDKWWPGGMSDAEWFCRQAGISPKPEFTKEDLLGRVPTIAIQMVERVLA